ncbi:CAAX prenyl protease 2 [Nannizzia gypsea CBS 118893]|uniref:intramembrane prenyl-peptidase Rce1 n=1 Tax=Arthroderma gypseum (strain ATCC MYA-4604 / CBS 118893) TaxID=535722 RepID=E4UZF1_ARTGP|nr:CAAX prenyl protease 2 [Nannizzia gypsea CBS 118893]EFR03481.1 CAAX prenyl protease 2 [Nannizzia gypsea CBS 118893]
MASGLFERLRHYYHGDKEPEPLISVATAVWCSILCTILYVAPLYTSKATRPGPTLSRDAPSLIKARIRAVMVSCFFCSIATFYFIVHSGRSTPLQGLQLLGWWPIGLPEIGKSLLLTAMLFMGPLFEMGIAEGRWRNWVRGRTLVQTLRSWTGWRNYVAGPITEEVTFRSIITVIHLMAKMSPGKIVFLTPLYFGIAHINHFYETKLAQPDTPLVPVFVRSLFQFTYTTIFGWYATFLYLRTGSLPAVILVHSFCNYCGLPRLWGRVETSIPIESTLIRASKFDEDENIFGSVDGATGLGWSVAYYILLFAGVGLFYYQFWPLTESSKALVSFSPKMH